MAMSKADIGKWIDSLRDGALVAIDDGGLALVEVGGSDYLEVGGVPEEENEMHQPSFEQAIKIAADSITSLRRIDVFRVLDTNRMDGLAAYIKEKRPDLAAEVDGCTEELVAGA